MASYGRNTRVIWIWSFTTQPQSYITQCVSREKWCKWSPRLLIEICSYLFVQFFARTNFRALRLREKFSRGLIFAHFPQNINNSVLLFAPFGTNCKLKQLFCTAFFQNIKFKMFCADKFSRTCHKTSQIYPRENFTVGIFFGIDFARRNMNLFYLSIYWCDWWNNLPRKLVIPAIIFGFWR